MKQQTCQRSVQNKNVFIYTGILFLAAFILRVVFAGIFPGHATDMSCFLYWSDRVVETGFRGFYSTEVFTDYPPGYMYLLYGIGLLRQFFQTHNHMFWDLILIKLPAICGDLLIAWFIFKISKQKSGRLALFLSFCYLFHPAVLFNSVVWGQVDSVFTCCIVGTIYLIYKKRYPLSYFVFAAGILIKPQALIFTPVVLFAVWENVFPKEPIRIGKQNLVVFSTQVMWGLLAILAVFAGMIPFGLGTVITQYIDTMSSYPYATVNAFNLWNLFGLNWAAQDTPFFILTCKQWGSLFIVLITIVSFCFFIKQREQKERYFLSAAFIITGMFLLSVRMHERYLFPVIPLLLCAYALNQRMEWLISFAVLSVGHFLNTVLVLFFADKEPYWYEFASKFCSILQLAGFAYFVYHMLKISRPVANKTRKETNSKTNQKGGVR